jgi:hypothetical protein
MANKSIDKATLQEAVDTVARAGTEVAAATHLGIPYSTLRNRLRAAKTAGLKPSKGLLDVSDIAQLKAALKRAETSAAAAQEKALTHEAIRRRIIGLNNAVENTEVPAWTQKISKAGAPGVPTLFVSDLHWGEVVNASQINGVNRYDVRLAHTRLDAMAEGATHLLKILSPAMDYPGIVLALGDMVSGNIHDELTHTNEMNTMPTVIDLWGKLSSLIRYMADTFGRVFIPCVTGNHGRDTHKIWNKDRHHTSFDWLLYCFLAKHFEADKRITFLIPDGPDAYFKIYNHRYLLTHGDQFRGGDGMIGALGPIIRGDHRKRSRNSQIDMAYDVMMIGHWHQYMHLTRLIVNGSLKGYDEYAYSNNFPFEFPQQALWLTHPKHGITYRMPVFVERKKPAAKTTWVSIAT